MAECVNCGHGSTWHYGVPGEPGGCIPYNSLECECPGFNLISPTAKSGGKAVPTKKEPSKEKTK